jgi:hypothetical protein
MRKLLRYGSRAAISEKELKLIHRYGSREAWLRAADLTSDPDKWRKILNDLKPWACSPVNLCKAQKGEIILISKVFIRIPDRINQLAEPVIVKIEIDPRKNPLTDKTEWIYLKGDDSPLRPTVGFSQKRAHGMPRKKALPFE